MPDPDEPFRRDMHQETSEEFFSGESDFFPLPLVFIIFGGKSNGTVSHSFDSVVADCDPMGIFPQVQNHGFRPVKRLLAVWHPFFAVTRVQKFFKSIMIAIGFRSAVKLKLTVFPKLLQFRKIFTAEEA